MLAYSIFDSGIKANGSTLLQMIGSYYLTTFRISHDIANKLCKILDGGPSAISHFGPRIQGENQGNMREFQGKQPKIEEKLSFDLENLRKIFPVFLIFSLFLFFSIFRPQLRGFHNLIDASKLTHCSICCVNVICRKLFQYRYLLRSCRIIREARGGLVQPCISPCSSITRAYLRWQNFG